MNDTTLESIIHWTEQGTVICIVDSLMFCKVVLPRYFKHNNWHSFVRQLNLYGFRKVYHFNISVDYVAGRQETIRQFKHQHFYSEGESNLSLIQRKTAPPCSASSSSPDWHQQVHGFLSEIEFHMDEMERQQEEIRNECLRLYQQQKDQEKMIVTLSNLVESLIKQKDLQQQGDHAEQHRNVNGSYGYTVETVDGCSLPTLAEVVSSISNE